MKKHSLLLLLLFCSIVFAQNTITGTVTDSKERPIPGANVKLNGENTNAVTDYEGAFALTTNKKPPYTITATVVGFESKTVTVTNNQKVTIKLTDGETKLNEVVVSASRTPERILESPVTIERMGAAQIKNTTAATFYDGIENLKEVHFNTSSISFKSINTRGFATIANTRFMQLVDGMDNSSPALNFVLGNLVGLSDLDVQSVELLPGASSALYGANAFNGILFMTSKSPFTYQGISTYYKYGMTSQEVAGNNPYSDFGFRAAHKFSEHFAMKANFSTFRATEWQAADTRDVFGGAEGHAANRNYDGMNIYGDEASTTIPNVGKVSRTGYAEKNLTDYNIQSSKVDLGIHIKPFKNDFEIILQHKLGLGNSIYQGASRYMLKNFIMQQSKVEVKGKNFFVRGYMTTEDAGNSYDMQSAALNINRAAKGDVPWFTDYATAYLQSSIFLGKTGPEADVLARNFADYNVSPAGLPKITPSGSPRLEPGSPEFASAFKRVTSNPDLATGAKFEDQSKLYHTDLNYNFKDLVKFAQIQVGGSYRKYIMNSKGTIFTDFDGPLNYNEYGAYTQLQTKLMDDRLKLSGSIRYDKSQNFKGQFSPRLAVVYSAGANKAHNFRFSFQTGFRNPTTQDQYIGLNIGSFALIGSAPDNLTRYTEERDVSFAGQTLNGGKVKATLNGENAYNNSYTVASVEKYQISRNPDDLQISKLGYIKPEQVKAFEVGYKSVLNGLGIDLSAYYNIYNDFSTQARVYTPLYGDVNTNPALAVNAIINNDIRKFQVYSNSTTQVNSLGFGAGLSKKIYKDFELNANYNFAEFNFDAEKDPSFVSNFNTPKHRIKASIGNAKLFKNFGFNVNVRWNTQYKWESSFADGMIPSVTVLDAQMSYAIPFLKSQVKVSASNLGGKDYLQVLGAGKIGQQYLVSWTINP
jgi:outer membrane receptor protein involved in Fe transport